MFIYIFHRVYDMSPSMSGVKSWVVCYICYINLHSSLVNYKRQLFLLLVKRFGGRATIYRVAQCLTSRTSMFYHHCFERIVYGAFFKTKINRTCICFSLAGMYRYTLCILGMPVVSCVYFLLPTAGLYKF